jgi:hypothetical protein
MLDGSEGACETLGRCHPLRHGAADLPWAKPRYIGAFSFDRPPCAGPRIARGSCGVAPASTHAEFTPARQGARGPACAQRWAPHRARATGNLAHAFGAARARASSFRLGTKLQFWKRANLGSPSHVRDVSTHSQSKSDTCTLGGGPCFTPASEPSRAARNSMTKERSDARTTPFRDQSVRFCDRD